MMAGTLAVYVHIPFCLRKCYYCDFNSYSGFSPSAQDEYLQALSGETERRAARPDVAGRLVTSIFVGGGTPTVMAGRELAGLLSALHRRLLIHPEAEVTVEANPGTVDFEKLRQLRLAGANRLSLGVQCFDDLILRRIGRVHSRAQAREAVIAAREAGFKNLNLDLISGLPGQTLASCQRTLREAVNLAPDHIAAYTLKVEEGTPFYEAQQRGELDLPGEDAEEDMLDLTASVLRESGYSRYEISNYARPGYESRHNLIYWQNREYLGLGAGAWSYLSGERFKNVEDPDSYIRAVASGSDPQAWGERLERDDQIRETMIMGLRLIDGIDLQEFRERFGETVEARFGPEIQRLVERGLLELGGGRLRLTGRGLKLGNLVWEQFV